MSPKKKKYSDEILRIRQLSALNKVLKKGDVENAFLNNTDKDVEFVKDSAAERMLEELNLGKNESKELEVFNSLIKEEITGSSRASSRPSIKKARRTIKMVRRKAVKKMRKAAPKKAKPNAGKAKRRNR